MAHVAQVRVGDALHLRCSLSPHCIAGNWEVSKKQWPLSKGCQFEIILTGVYRNKEECRPPEKLVSTIKRQLPRRAGVEVTVIEGARKIGLRETGQVVFDSGMRGGALDG